MFEINMFLVFSVLCCVLQQVCVLEELNFFALFLKHTNFSTKAQSGDVALFLKHTVVFRSFFALLKQACVFI